MLKEALSGVSNIVIDAMKDRESVKENWWNKVSEALPREWIKQRQGPGGKVLDYIEGHKVVELIAKASMGTYSFLVLDARIEEGHPVPLKVRNERGYEDPVVEITCPSCGKPYRTVKRFRQTEAECAHCRHKVPFSLYPGDPVLVRTEPIAHVLGMLIVPGVGAVMQWGSKILQGGSSEQEHALKAATTDALKKCASLLGVALELYEKDDDASSEAVQAFTQIKEGYELNGYAYRQPEQEHAPARLEPASAQAAPKAPEVQTPPAPAAQAGHGESSATAQLPAWPQEEVERLNRLRQLMGIPQDNRNMLNPLISAWSKGKIESWRGLTPENIKDFNDYLESLIYEGDKTQAG